MVKLQQIYQQVILDHSRLLSGFGELWGGEHYSHQVNPTCGDEIYLEIEYDAEKDQIHLVWNGDGCSISQASASMLHTLLEGKSLATVQRLYHYMEQMMHSQGKGIPEEILSELEDAAALENTSTLPNRIKCALLGWYALKDALLKADIII